MEIHEYENDTIKYSENNYTETHTIGLYNRPWALSMKEIYFYNETKDKIVINLIDNRLTFFYNLGFIIGSNNYKKLIYENYFKDLINKNICELEISEKTIYNRINYNINTDGSFFYL